MNLRSHRATSWWILAGVLALGCEGRIGEPGPTGGNASSGSTGGTIATGGSTGNGVNPTGGMPIACDGRASPGRTPLRRLTRTEYSNAVRDLLHDMSNVSSTFPPEEETKGFLNNADAYTTSDLHVDKYQTAAETVAATARVGGQFKLPCMATVESCARGFIQSFGLKAFRRPLEAAEVDSYYARFQLGASGGFEEGIEWVVGRMLASPNFLYRIERDTGPVGTPYPISGYELATRLAYFLWETTPDDALIASAAKGALGDRAGIGAEVQRMMADPRFNDTLSSFHDQWLSSAQVIGIAKTNPITPAWDLTLQSSVLQETDLFIQDIFSRGESLQTMLTAQYSFVNGSLAQFYGLKGGPAGTTFAKVDKVPNRYGLLTLPSILAVLAHSDQSAPVKRGKFIREQLLCTSPPDPPMNLVITVPKVTPGTTTRQRFEMHRTQASCAACHTLMDPLAMPLEFFDEFGRHRDTDQGLPIDGRGELTSTSAQSPLVSTPEELGQKLSELPEVGNCVVIQWFRFASGHTEEQADTCMLNELTSRFKSSGQNMRDLLIGIATSDAFRYRVDM